MLEGGSYVAVEEEGVGAEQNDAQQRPVHETGTFGVVPPTAETAPHHALDHLAPTIDLRVEARTQTRAGA